VEEQKSRLFGGERFREDVGALAPVLPSFSLLSSVRRRIHYSTRSDALCRSTTSLHRPSTPLLSSLNTHLEFSDNEQRALQRG
jgi:hypothetical protein